MKTKNILITGGTGFLGQALVDQWLEQGHRMTLLSRRPQWVTQQWAGKVAAVSRFEQLPVSEQIDAVVNLAGEPIFGRRWSQTRKQQLRASRIELTECLVDYLAGLPVKPEVLISGSAIGVYGDQGDTLLTEASAGIADFAQQLCADWEAAANRAQAFGVRVCTVRTGLVLGHDGGLLQRMLPPFRLGLGGRLGRGQQWMSWVHRQDWLAIVDRLLMDASLQGPFNAVAPNPVSNAEFSRCLASQLRRPALLPLPEWLLRLVLGEMADLVLASQRVSPARMLGADFDFLYPDLELALAQILSND